MLDKNTDFVGFLKVPRSGKDVEEALYLRTQLQIDNPLNEKLTKQVYPYFKDEIPNLSGTMMDIWCYGGWLYPFVKDHVDYHGIDVWPEAIAAAKRRFPEGKFTVKNLREIKLRADIVCGFQLHPQEGEDFYVPALSRLANKVAYWTGNNGYRFSEYFSSIEWLNGYMYKGIK